MAHFLGGFGDVYKVSQVKAAGSNEGPKEFGAMKTELATENNHPMMNRLKVELSEWKLYISVFSPLCFRYSESFRIITT